MGGFRTRAVLLVALLAAALSVVGTGALSAPRERVSFGTAISVMSTPYYVMANRGLLTKRGLDADLRLFNSGQEVAKALAVGDLTFGDSAVNNFQAAIQAGLDVVGFMVLPMGEGGSRNNDRPLAIVASGESGVRKPEDLRGKTVGLSLGGSAELYLRAVERAGLSADRDFRMVQVLPTNAVQALRSRQVDAISGWEPFPTQILREVPGSTMVVRGGGYFNYISFALTRRSMFQSRPDLVKKYIEAAAEAAWLVRRDARQAAQAASTWMPGVGLDVLVESLGNVPFDPRITEYTRIAWDTSYRFLSRYGRLKGPVPMQGYVDTTLLNEVVREHPEWFADLQPARLLQLRIR